MNERVLPQGGPSQLSRAWAEPSPNRGRAWRRVIVGTWVIGLALFGLVGGDASSQAVAQAENANDTSADSALSPVLAKAIVQVDILDAEGTVVSQATGAILDEDLFVTALAPLRRGDKLLASWSGGQTSLVEGVVLFDRELDLALVKLRPASETVREKLPLVDAPEPGDAFEVVEFGADRQISSTTATVIEKPLTPPPSDQLLCDAAPTTSWRGVAWVTTKGALAGFGSGEPAARAGESLAVTGRQLKNLLRRQRERVPLTLPELRAKLVTLTPAITQLFPSRKLAPAKADRGEQLAELRADLRFRGPEPTHPFLLGEYRTAAGWDLIEKRLVAPAAEPASLRIATADEFGLEAELEAAGNGGWFLALGWVGNSGWVLSNVTMRTSGSPWHICRVENGVADVATHKEVARTSWKGVQKLGLALTRNSRGEYRLDGQLAGKPFLDGVALPGYSGGDVYLATYVTKYGPMPVKVNVLRAKSFASKADGKPAAPPPEDKPADNEDKGPPRK
jgi:hypothetical protein